MATPASLADVPILMYHHVAVPPPDADPLRVDLSVPPDIFEAEMKYLSDKGYHTIHLADLINHWQNQAPLPEKPIIVTFDDGYDDNYLNAFPTLKDFDMVGTFFIITNRPDSSSYGYMTWEQLEEMAANGMEIGSHSLDHRYDLGRMPSWIQMGEIKPAEDALARHFPNAPRVFAYPSGSYNNVSVSILQELGYVAAVTTRQGVWQSSAWPLLLRRIRVRGGWSVSDFAYWFSYWTRGL